MEFKVCVMFIAWQSLRKRPSFLRGILRVLGPYTMNQAEYFCGMCGLQVKEDESSIQCENECMLWFHVVCTNLTDDQFCQLSSADVIWECPACRDPELPGGWKTRIAGSPGSPDRQEIH